MPTLLTCRVNSTFCSLAEDCPATVAFIPNIEGAALTPRSARSSSKVCLVSARRQSLPFEHVPTVAIVNHVEENDEADKFYAQAEVILTQDVSHAQLELEDVHFSFRHSADERKSRKKCL
jgi:hypothetical protein